MDGEQSFFRRMQVTTRCLPRTPGRPRSHLTLTYGLRWEIHTPPVSATAGQPLYVMQGIFDSNPLAVVPGTLWHTRFDDFAPRVGAAYQITPKTVVRGALGSSMIWATAAFGALPRDFPISAFRVSVLFPSVPFDLTNPVFQPPPFSTTIDAKCLISAAVDPNLRLPFTMQWNAAIERGLGANQTLTATYVGSTADDCYGRMQSVRRCFESALASGGSVDATRNAGYAHFNALQIQFQRHMSHGLQALVSYSLAKSSDLGSADEPALLRPA